MTLSEDIFFAAGHSFRSVEKAQNLKLPTGSRLRGVQIVEGLFIARDKKFYLYGTHGIARPITDEAVWKLHSFTSLVAAIKQLAETRARTMRKRTGESS